MNNELILLAVAIAAGLLVSRGARALKLPNVTAFLVAGLFIGPGIANLITKEHVETMSIISTAALGFIAFSIGGEFKLSHLKQIGSAPLTITMYQGIMTALLLDLGLIGLGFLIPGLFGSDPSLIVPQAIMMGAIGLATAPAATLMVIRQYKADGPVARMLLPVVAMDDALGLVVFSISSAVASGLLGGQITFTTMVLTPLWEIVGSLALGTAIGALTAFVAKFFRSRGNKLALAIAAVLGGVGLCDILGFSSLLVCMMIGAVVVNFSSQQQAIMEQTDRFTPPVFLLFFVLSGADLDVAVLPSVGLLGVAYIVIRSFGKWFGAMLGATVEKSDHNIRKYLGFALLPQAGVAIGMARIVSAQFPQFGAQINAIVLAATLIYELLGPVITKIALTKAGEIRPHHHVSKAASGTA